MGRGEEVYACRNQILNGFRRTGFGAEAFSPRRTEAAEECSEFL